MPLTFLSFDSGKLKKIYFQSRKKKPAVSFLRNSNRLTDRLTDGEEMGGQGAHDLVLVLGHDIQAVDVEHPVGVDCHQDGP